MGDRLPHPSLTLNPEMEARISEDMKAFLARKSPIATTSAQQSPSRKEYQESTPAVVEVKIPSAPKHSPSRLRKSWGPEDVDDEVEATPNPEPDSEPEPEPVTRIKINARRPKLAQPPSDISISRGSSPAGRKLRGSDHMPCPVCLGTPFHLRYRCPVIVAGSEAVEERLKELKLDKSQPRSGLIQELEQIIQTKEARAGFGKSAASSPPPVPPQETSKSAIAVKEATPRPLLPSRQPTIPTDSRMSEVIVENRDEGSSNEGSDSADTTSSSASSSDYEDSENEDEEHDHVGQDEEAEVERQLCNLSQKAWKASLSDERDGEDPDVLVIEPAIGTGQPIADALGATQAGSNILQPCRALNFD